MARVCLRNQKKLEKAGIGLRTLALKQDFKGGDTLWVEYQDKVNSQRLKTFTGICLGKSSKGSDEVIQVRSVVGGVGVVYGFHTLSKNIKDIKVVRKLARRGGRVKRNDLRFRTMR